MPVSYSANSGYGFQLKLDRKIMLNPEFSVLRNMVWDKAEETTREYYGSKEEMFNEDNFDVHNVSELFPPCRLEWCSNSYISNKSKEWLFVIAPTSFSEIEDEVGFVELGSKKRVPFTELKQLENFKLLLPKYSVSETGWFSWLNIS